MIDLLVCTNDQSLAEKFQIKQISENEELSALYDKNKKSMNVASYLPLLRASLYPKPIWKNLDLKFIFFLLVDEANKIIGGSVIGYREDGWTKKEFHYAMRSISVAKKHKGKGLSKILIRAMFDFLASNNIDSLLQSSYEPEGEVRVKHNFHKIAAEYPKIVFFDKEA